MPILPLYIDRLASIGLSEGHGGLRHSLGVGYLAHYFVESVPGLLLGQACVTLAMSGILATILTFLAQVAPESKEGSVYGVNQSIDAVVGSIDPVTGSTLAAQLGLRAPSILAEDVFGLAGAAAARWLPRKQI